jgi:glucose dehydrogenase
LLAMMATVVRAQHAGDWPLHNYDIKNSRFAPHEQINTTNVDRLVVKWTFEMPAKESVASVTPLVVDGVMYINAGSSLYAVDAATGVQKWKFALQTAFAGSGRGPTYGDGVVYAYGRGVVFAVDAKTGTAVESFGDKGTLPIAARALHFKYPQKYTATIDGDALGYQFTAPPAYSAGMLYVGTSYSENLIRGGLVIAADAKTGAVKWVFNTVPQGPEDEGWAIAKDTWGTGAKLGGGIWTQPAVDSELGLLFVNASNPAADYDGSAREGMNLFTNSALALRLVDGKLVWHFQTIHHDIWDYDMATGPVLFDVTSSGRLVKGIASLGKTCYAYMWNRGTGTPLNPIVETPVPTITDVPGEKVWPTQPIPYTSSGVPQTPFCAIYPIIDDPELAQYVRPEFHPYLANQWVITSPGNIGGANWGSPSFSPRTGLLYATGKSDAHALKPKPVGDSLADKQGPAIFTHADVAARLPTKFVVKMNLGAYDPLTGRLMWHAEMPGSTNSGNMVTGGDLVFQALGIEGLYALDARSGRVLFRFKDSNSIRSSPLTYLAGGKQFVAVTATNKVLALALP